MVEINWTQQSIDDIENVAQFIAKDSHRFAQIQTERFFEYTVILEKHPRAGKMVPEINKSNIRELILGNYRIVYKIISSKKIDILSIHHSAMLLTKEILKRKNIR